MTLIWKLLRQHISIGQLAGFFFANLFGMMIVLLSIQFYKDIIPMFTEGDSFMKKDYIIVSKRIFRRQKQYLLSARNKRTEGTAFHRRDRYLYPFTV